MRLIAIGTTLIGLLGCQPALLVDDRAEAGDVHLVPPGGGTLPPGDASASEPGGSLRPTPAPPRSPDASVPPPSPDASVPPRPPDAGAPPRLPDAGADVPFGAEHVFCVEETNRYRATVGRPPLVRSAALERYADEGARADAASHTPHGHFSATGGGGIAWAENEVPWWDGGPGDVMNVIREGLAAMWSEGPGGGHYDNMTGDARELGCGIHVGGGAVTVVQDFGAEGGR
jgi:uncharacterized protein YkwD